MNVKRFFAVVSVMILWACTILQACGETVYVYTLKNIYGDKDIYEYTLNPTGEAWIVQYLDTDDVLSIDSHIANYQDRYKVIGICTEAFADCKELKCVDIPDNVAIIGVGAFRNCTDLVHVDIPASVTYIGADAFAGCSQLMCLVQQGSYAEQYCIKNGLDYLYGCIDYEMAYEMICEDERRLLRNYADELVDITHGEVKHIADKAYSNKKELRSVHFEIGLQSIGMEAFRGCEQLLQVTIPDTVTSIGVDPFVMCNENLTVSVMPGSYAEEYCKRYGIGYDYHYGFMTDTYSGESIEFYYGTGGDVFVPDKLAGVEIKKIGYTAFCGRTNVRSVVIPDSVEEIVREAFTECTALEYVKMSESLLEIGAGAFAMCSSLRMVVIPEKVTTIVDAFDYCTSLETVVIPASVNEMYHPFDNCPALKTIYVKRGSYAEQYCVENNLPYAYYGEYPVGKICRIGADSARIRSGAGTEFEVVGTVMRGERYEVLGILPASNGKTWYQIKKDGMLCWISSGVCDIE